MALELQTSPSDVTAENLAQIAVSLERSAAATYCRLAQKMTRLHNPAAVEMFERLMEVGKEHEREVRHRIRTHGMPEPRVDADLSAEANSKAEDRAARDLVLTPWRALNLAVQKERDAFELFTSIAANSNDEEVRQQAENFASLKLEHLTLLRLERKRAYRTAERTRLEAIVGRDLPRTMAEYTQSADRVLAALCDRYKTLSEDAENAGDAFSAGLLRDLAGEIDHIRDTPSHPDEEPIGSVTEILRAALRETEAAFDAFMAVAENATDEDMALAAQDMAAGCVKRLERLRDRLTAHLEDLD